jgi:hypothetical protein
MFGRMVIDAGASELLLAGVATVVATRDDRMRPVAPAWLGARDFRGWARGDRLCSRSAEVADARQP